MIGLYCCKNDLALLMKIFNTITGILQICNYDIPVNSLRYHLKVRS